jgi:hypothetical protein
VFGASPPSRTECAVTSEASTGLDDPSAGVVPYRTCEFALTFVVQVISAVMSAGSAETPVITGVTALTVAFASET